ncbi:branched-chain amino acid ABC transporter permease [Candidatus Woesearchaeota archaeon]|nr:branched-chain amino acid ABC transporter permease [Candidatus Woesearchaeota archaeon]
MDLSIAVQLVLNSILAGGIYALIALGYTMVYGVLKFINFAHGEIFMIGAYTAYAASVALPMQVAVPFSWFMSILVVLFLAYHIPFDSFFKKRVWYQYLIIAGILLVVAKSISYFFLYLLVHALPLWISALISIIVCAILGFVIEKVGYKKLRGKDRLTPLITAIGFSIILQALALLMFGGEIRSFEYKTQESYEVFGASITPHQLLIILTSIIIMILLHLFLKYTKYGKAMRAVTDNMDVAKIIGINPDKVISLVFMIGSGLAAVAGILIGIEQNLHPTMGIVPGIKAFTAAVIGGIGNIYGAVLGGYFIGFAENIGIWFIPSGYKDAIAFVILLLMLLLKPSGFFGQQKEEEVRA